MSTVKLIKNKTDRAFRFDAVTEFLPGQTVAVSEETIKARPAIQVLIKNGLFEVEGADKTPQATEDEIVEE